jgi:hypothetical protein
VLAAELHLTPLDSCRCHTTAVMKRKASDYLRCTPIGHLFERDTDKHRANVVLHAESR